MAGSPAIIELNPRPLPDAEVVARMFRTLTDATHLRIVELLIDEDELHQIDIVRRLRASQGRVSEHLAPPYLLRFRGDEKRRPQDPLPRRRRAGSVPLLGCAWLPGE